MMCSGFGTLISILKIIGRINLKKILDTDSNSAIIPLILCACLTFAVKVFHF